MKVKKIYLGTIMALIMAFLLAVSVMATENADIEDVSVDNIVESIDTEAAGASENIDSVENTAIIEYIDDIENVEDVGDAIDTGDVEVSAKTLDVGDGDDFGDGGDSDDEGPDDGDPDDDNPDPGVEPGPSVEGVALVPQTVTLDVVGQTAQLTVKTTPDEDTIESTSWSSSDSSIASVDANGIVTAGSKSGTATITVKATYDGQTFTDTCDVKVSLSTGFYQDPNGSDWYYYVNGQKSTGTTDVMEGTVDGKSGWWNVVNGKVTRSETVAQNSNGWWYIDSNGKVDFSYNGFAKNGNGWWYIEGGKVIFSTNSVIQDTNKKIDGTNGWWYVVGGKVQTSYTGVANYANTAGWWYVKNGKVDFSANTVAQNDNGWWYVEGGKVNFSYNGFAKNDSDWWYMEAGKAVTSKNSVIQDTKKVIDGTNGWWYVVGGKVQTSYTGVTNYSNSNGWWYVKNGKVDFSANTVAQNNNGWWYVLGGKVQFGYTGVANYANSAGWWYIKNGKVDFSANTVAQNNNGWWYVSGGKVDFSFNGIASNSNGRWVINNGKVNFGYNGTYTYGGSTYNVTNGKATFPYESMGMSSSMYNKAQSQSSSTKWLVLVDVTNCKLGIFQGSYGNWTPVKCWTCTTGASSTPTIIGSFTIYDKGKSFGDGYTCWWYNRFYNGYMIHSILYNPGSMTSVQDGRLGMHLSHGCVRLALENAKWVYDNVPYSTRVVTYK